MLAGLGQSTWNRDKNGLGSPKKMKHACGVKLATEGCKERYCHLSRDHKPTGWLGRERACSVFSTQVKSRTDLKVE